MAVDQHSDICARAREHCRQHGWYGPDADKPRSRFSYSFASGAFAVDQLPHSKIRGRGLTHVYDAERDMLAITFDNATDPRNHDFECLPATEEQLAATERALGFPLPPLLRALYANVANGGFGPDYGITGAAGGWTVDDDDHSDTLDRIDLHLDKDRETRYVELAEYDRDIDPTFKVVLPFDEYPAHFMPFCYGGCGLDHCIDLKTGRIYANLGGVRDTLGRWSLGVVREALSLDDWIDAWLRDNSHASALLSSGGSDSDSDIPY